MASEEDNFDIDIYGDGEGEQGIDGAEAEISQENDNEYTFDEPSNVENAQNEIKQENGYSNGHNANGSSNIPHTDGAAGAEGDYPKQAPQQQGIKRKESSDDRPIDPGATTALLISELHWWSTEDDIRGWANQAGCEDELKDVTFSEHKVNGKSKGQAFVEFGSPQAASATKHKIEALGSVQSSARKHTVVYTNPLQNPFKTLPKDAPARGKDERPQRSGSTSSYNNSGAASQSSYSINNGGFRGGRGGGYNNRGAMNNNSNNTGGGNFNNRGSFSSPMNGYNNVPMGGGFPNTVMNGMNNFGGGFGNRGGGMINNNMRGGGGMRGRGNMGGGMMAMGGMGMGQLGMGGNMNPMMAGMSMQGGFQGNPHFNPAFFQANNQTPTGTDGSWNPHGAKRTRQE